jgi:hypothetical protein
MRFLRSSEIRFGSVEIKKRVVSFEKIPKTIINSKDFINLAIKNFNEDKFSLKEQKNQAILNGMSEENASSIFSNSGKNFDLSNQELVFISEFYVKLESINLDDVKTFSASLENALREFCRSCFYNMQDKKEDFGILEFIEEKKVKLNSIVSGLILNIFQEENFSQSSFFIGLKSDIISDSNSVKKILGDLKILK